MIEITQKDGGHEVEAVAWNERENAFTDFWEQCPKLVDASDVGKARQAFMAGMDAASFFDGPATGYEEKAKFRERLEAVLGFLQNEQPVNAALYIARILDDDE